MRGGARGRSRGLPRYPRPMLEPCYLPPGSYPDIYGYPVADAGDEGAGAGARGGSAGPGLTDGASSVAAKEEAAALVHRNRTCGAAAAVCEHAKQCQPKFSKQSRGNCGPLARRFCTRIPVARWGVTPGRAVVVDSFKTRVESAFGFSA